MSLVEGGRQEKSAPEPVQSADSSPRPSSPLLSSEQNGVGLCCQKEWGVEKVSVVEGERLCKRRVPLSMCRVLIPISHSSPPLDFHEACAAERMQAVMRKCVCGGGRTARRKSLSMCRVQVLSWPLHHHLLLLSRLLRKNAGWGREE